MLRQHSSELLEDMSLPPEVVARAYRDLARLHRWLGNDTAILRLLRTGPTPIHSVLDLGCGHGALLQHIRRDLGLQVLGFDLRPAPAATPVRILTGNAVSDPLPSADVAIALCLTHHLSETEVVQLIHNVSRSCRRLILLDLVRHRLPLILFRVFVAPLLQRINSADGTTSIRRSFTPAEFRAIVAEAVQGSSARVSHTVAPLYNRQVIDIRWGA
jgi:2-polyprenyl-3-methyl-5-hydroxy-6-metoxy-1,4-benzoquinol methylase